MELQPSAAPLPPHLVEVRRRHPDVDIVVLPADPVDRDGTVAPDALVRQILGRVDEVSPRLGRAVGWAPPPAEIRYGAQRGTVRARTHCSLVHRAGERVLGSLASDLAACGWEVRRPAGDVRRLVARTDGLELRASWAEATGVFLLDLSSGPVRVGETRARSMVQR